MMAGWLLAAALQQSLVFGASTEVVRVDVLVTRGGRPVPGLQIADFQIWENGSAQKIESLGTDANTALDVLLLFDMSASTKGPVQRGLLQAASAVMQGLRPTDRAGLLSFTHEVRRRTALTSDFDSVMKALQASKAEGSTSLGDSLLAASLAFDKSDARRLIFLFTDGADTSSFLEDHQVIDALARADVLVYSFNLTDRAQPVSFLRAATEVTGGRMVSETNPAKLADAFRAALTEVRARYLLGYVPNGNMNPGWRKLEVRVRGGGLIRTRKGYAR